MWAAIGQTSKPGTAEDFYAAPVEADEKYSTSMQWGDSVTACVSTAPRNVDLACIGACGNKTNVPYLALSSMPYIPRTSAPDWQRVTERKKHLMRNEDSNDGYPLPAPARPAQG